ncbi:MAG: glycosyltransferase family 4 protein [Deltaproteobacteria bacterium]|nr:glycosyltransferase family 4 protein [Deltaproteobacteria bacterium]
MSADGQRGLEARVCMLVHHRFPRDVRVRRQARALLAAGAGVRVIALRAPGEPARERWQGIEVRRLPVRRHRGAPIPVYLAEYAAFASMAALRLAAGGPFDVIHVHAPPDWLLLAALAGRARGARLVLDIHDLSPELYAERFGDAGGALARTALLGSERLACALADRVLTVTRAFARVLASRGVPQGKIGVLHNCPDEEIFSPEGGEERRGRRGELRIVHCGTLVRRYGADVLLDAFGRLALERSGVRLDIYGEGDHTGQLARRIREAPLAGRVFLHGDVPQEQVARALARADLCAVPNRSSAFTDLLLPTKLLEALRMGCPVVASDTPVLREMAAEGARLVPPGDADGLYRAMRELCDDAGARARLRRAGLRVARRFAWAEEKQNLLELYREIVG